VDVASTSTENRWDTILTDIPQIAARLTDKPRRIQLKRTKGWRIPENTVSVARPHRHGNPFRVGDFGIPDAATAVVRFKEWRQGMVVGPPIPSIADLVGKNVACFCGFSEPCHGDALIEEAAQYLRNQDNG
jgi:hypothetical protein